MCAIFYIPLFDKAIFRAFCIKNYYWLLDFLMLGEQEPTRFSLKPSNIMATFIKATRMQRFVIITSKLCPVSIH